MRPELCPGPIQPQRTYSNLPGRMGTGKVEGGRGEGYGEGKCISYLHLARRSSSPCQDNGQQEFAICACL